MRYITCRTHILQAMHYTVCIIHTMRYITVEHSHSASTALYSLYNTQYACTAKC